MAGKDNKRKPLLDLFRRQPDKWLSLADVQQLLHTLRHWLSDAVANAELQATGRT